MKFYPDRVTDIRIAYIGGGSRGWAWGLMNDLAREEQLSGAVRLYDIDYRAACDNEAIGNRLLNHADAKSPWRYAAVATIGEALEGADFVIISILPGTFKEMESDVHAPEKYGIYQSVGDTTGPGGIVRAMRAIPMFFEIGEAIRRFCPGVWVINYTNPMSLCTRALYHVFPQIKAFGCCHEVFSTQELCVRILQEFRGIEGVDRREVKLNVLGINHFTWVDACTYAGESLMGLYGEFAEKYHEPGFEGPEPGSVSYFTSGQRVKMDLFRRYGIIAAAGDRHLAEFCPPWYLKSPKTVAEWQFSLTPVSYRVMEYGMRLERAARLKSGEETMQLGPTGEEGVLQMKALLGLKDFMTNVNLPNMGQVEGLPAGCIVETNAWLGRNSMRPIMAGRLPDEVHSLVLRQAVNQETVLKAAALKSKDVAFRAFANDPLMTASIGDARALFSEMTGNTRAYLQGWE